MRSTKTKGFAKTLKSFFVFLFYFLIGTAVGALLFLAYFLIKPQEVKVPDVKGLSLEEASLIIKKAGLKVGQVQGTGFVDRTYPYAGDVVRKGREITLFLSDPFELAVPNLVGAPKETAEKILLAMGFKVRIVQLPYKGTDGRVLGVYPPPGSKLKEGGEVSLLVDVGEP